MPGANIRRTMPALFTLLFLLDGCTSEYRATTTLHSDGNVDREILQPQNDTPEPALGPQLWNKVEVIDHNPASGRSIIQDREGRRAQVGREKYIKAAGRFNSPDKIPEYFAHSPRVEGVAFPAGKLVRRYTRNDYVFIVEHLWTETLTDTVTLAGMRQSREALADLAIDITQAIFNEVLSDKYDAVDLFKWARTDGKVWLAEATDYLFVAMESAKKSVISANESHYAAQIQNDLADLCARRGLNLRRNGNLVDSDTANQIIREFLIDLICRHVRQKSNGRAVDRATVAAWLAALQNDDNAHERTREAFRNAFVKVVAEKYGGEDALKKRAAPLVIGVTGVYWLDLFTLRQFDYTLQVPGQIIAGNGTLLDDNKIRWQIDARRAWPLGFEMACHSLESQGDAQQQLLGRMPLSTRAAMIEFIKLVEDYKLLKVLSECKRGLSMDPLRAHRRARIDEANADEIRALERLFKMLEIQ